MPLLSIETNQSAKTESLQEILKSASALVAAKLGKSEKYVMVKYSYNENILFAGDNQASAFLQLKSIGLPESATSGLAKHLCELVENQLLVSKNRIYIEFIDAPRKMWGYDGHTF